MNEEAINSVIQHGIDNIDNLKGSDIYGCDLHHHLYNEDYFIIGYHQASEFLKNYGVFNAIGEIQEYEQDNFGEVNTDLSSSEQVANMFAYIHGEEALNECTRLQEKWNNRLTDKDLDVIKEELQGQLK